PATPALRVDMGAAAVRRGAARRGRSLGLYFVRLSGLGFFYGLLGVLGSLGAKLRLVTVFGGHFVSNFNFGWLIRMRSAIDLGINQRERHFRHARRLAVAGAGKDYVFHARTTQGLGRLLAQHP